VRERRHTQRYITKGETGQTDRKERREADRGNTQGNGKRKGNTHTHTEREET
jgi:hypothetical protein